MSDPKSDRTNVLQAMSREKFKEAVGLLENHTNRRIHILKLGLTQRQDCRLSAGTYCVLVSVTGIQNFGSYLLEDQGSRNT
jgi:hypothetical protein